MEFFAGLDVSMKETHICVVDCEGAIVLETSTSTLPEAIAGALARAPGCQRVVLETGRIAPTLYHGLEARGVPVTCIESRQAHLALKSLATHKTDRNDARGLAQLARTGFFKPVHVKSLPAHAVRALILARKKLVGQRVTLENQIRGLAVVFGVRLPRGLSPAFAQQVASGSQGVPGVGLRNGGAAGGAQCRAGGDHRDRSRHEASRAFVGSLSAADDHSRGRPTDGARLRRGH
jgi:transposase